MDGVQDFFTIGSFGSLAGATVIVSVLTNTFRLLFGLSPRWFAFVASLTVVMVGGCLAGALNSTLEWVLASLNGCLVFCTSAGVQEGVSAAKNPEHRVASRSKTPVKWYSSWFRG